METTTLLLAKENFKFSAGHFLIFDEKHAERLHGHNYQVRVEISVPEAFSMESSGYFVDFSDLKKLIKARLDQWDEIVLLPGLNSEMIFSEKGDSLEVKFRDRFYVFPRQEVLLLPVTNTSVEQLSRILAHDLLSLFKKYKVSQVQVCVEETLGQGACTRAKAE